MKFQLNQTQVVAAFRPWRLAPSDFAFLFAECAYCFKMKVACNRPRPRTPFPSVFTRIDLAMKERYVGERAEDLVDGLPAGVIGGSEWVKSEALWLPGLSRPLLITGQLDTTVACDDGSVVILDFKTSEPSADHVGVYSRQLHAYALAAERPASGRPRDISGIGLVCFLPDSFNSDPRNGMLSGEVKYVSIERDRRGFEDFLLQVGLLLEGPELPSPSPTCVWCKWQQQGQDGRVTADPGRIAFATAGLGA
jgi:hypothetical protein